MTVQVDNLPVNDIDCVFTTGATSISSQAVMVNSDTVTCTLNGVPAVLFTDDGMDCVMYLQCMCPVCDYSNNVLCYQIFIKYSLLS